MLKRYDLPEGYAESFAGSHLMQQISERIREGPSIDQLNLENSLITSGVMERKLFNQTERVEVQVIRERTTLEMETFIQALKAEKPVVLYVVGVGDVEQFRQPLYKIIWYGENQLTFLYLGESKTESAPSTWSYEEFYNTVEPMRLVYDKRFPCSPR